MGDNANSVSYWYEGLCPETGQVLRLPRTREVETLAQALMVELAGDRQAQQEGKMYGLLLAEDGTGQRLTLRAFSGLLNGQSHVPGWVPPIPGRDRLALQEAQTLAQLDQLKQQIIVLNQIPERSHQSQQAQRFEQALRQMGDRHRQRKAQRQQQRQTLTALSPADQDEQLEALREESRRDGIERRQLKRQRDRTLAPLAAAITQADAQIRQLKQQRKALSRQLQQQMHAVYSLTNFGGQSQTLAQLMPQGLPTGTGDCCAPKLLHAAASQGLQPIALAEFWWGPSLADKVQGQFYGACDERCQPLMGFLLGGLSQQLAQDQPHQSPIQPPSKPPFVSTAGEMKLDWGMTPGMTLLYEDDQILALDKPAGLLTVPGRRSDRQDSALSRPRLLHPQGDRLVPVHRLDQATSGILLLAKDAATQRLLQQQFQRHQVEKRYEALLAGPVLINEGEINLPLWGDPSDRPRQSVHWQKGKPSLSRFRVLDRQGQYTRLEFCPITGRTHQLRVHARAGLGPVILGDRLYGCCANASRLHLHAKQLYLPPGWDSRSPQKAIDLRSQVPF